MTIDEAINHAREIAMVKRADADWKWRNGRLNADDCISCAENHEQLAEWLELLKWYQQGMGDIPSESGVLPKDVYRAGYIKAIDDFVKALKEGIFNGYATLEDYFENYIECVAVEDIDRIAEQLKEGGVE